jgi:hypothetical protein
VIVSTIRTISCECVRNRLRAITVSTVAAGATGISGGAIAACFTARGFAAVGLEAVFPGVVLVGDAGFGPASFVATFAFVAILLAAGAFVAADVLVRSDARTPLPA